MIVNNNFFSFFYILQIKVDVYYESLCPDSQKFLTEQLYPNSKIFAEQLDIKLIPYGKSSVSIFVLMSPNQDFSMNDFME